MQPLRRQFLKLTLPLLGASAAPLALAQSVVQETDLLARTLDYVSDTTRAKQADYPSHTNQMMCRRCKSFRGDVGAASGPCKTFNNQIVSASGWCSAFDPRSDATSG
jgi:hypothetical protein